MPRFVCKTPVEHDGKPYRKGDVVVLTDEQAKAIPWAVEPAPVEKQSAPPPKSTAKPEPSEKSVK